MKDKADKKERAGHVNSLEEYIDVVSEEELDDRDKIVEKILDLESVIKGALSDLDDEQSPEIIMNKELVELEEMVKGALSELTDLETQFEDIFSPPSEIEVNQEGNYLMAVRRFQNAMKVALFDGATKKNFKIYEEGFNFYKNGLEILASTGNQAEIEQYKSELAQILIKIVTDTEHIGDSDFQPYLFIACKKLAEVYDSFKQFKTGLKFHDQAGGLAAENQLLADFEYFQVVLDHLLLDDLESAIQSSYKIKLKHFKILVNELIESFKEKKIESIDKVKNKIEVLCAQRGIETININYLFSIVRNCVIEESEEKKVEEVEVFGEKETLSSEKIEEIRDSLTRGIQQLQQAYPNIQIPIGAQIDTSALVSEITQAISSEISKEIKSLSDDIVSKIINRIPRATVASASLQPRSAGTIYDDGVPEIEIVEGAPQERPSRPKLDDMIDSIIVSE